jgi:small nuclear ribonucleoprotein (snRNP)-like protein
MAAVTGRKFFEELGQLVGKPVVVEDAQGKSYEGNLLGFDTQSMSVAMGEVKGSSGTLYHRLFLTGNVIAKIMATDTPFNLAGLKERLERVFPNKDQAKRDRGNRGNWTSSEQGPGYLQQVHPRNLITLFSTNKKRTYIT